MTHLPDSTTLLWRLHADQLMLVRDDGLHNAMLGFAMVASRFNHTPPSSLDLEYGIQLIEDALQPLRAHCAGLQTYITDDTLFRHLCQRLKLGNTLSREQVESHFDAVCQTLNRPMAMAHLDMSNQEVAYLLVLREAMHHLDLPQMALI